MATELAVIEREFSPRLPAFRDVLAPFRIMPDTFKAGVLAYFERNANTLKYCDAGSVMSSCMSIAVLGVRLDPASGQSCVVPFKGKAQPIIMVNGYTVIAGRAGYTLQGRLVREGEHFKEYGGSNPRIEHEPILANKGKIIGAYAVARSNLNPTLFTPLLSIDDLLATRDRSQGYRSAKEHGNSHPWITDVEAMMVKTPKRLLAKDIPNDLLHMASWLETQHDLGRAAYLDQGGQGKVIDLEAESPFPGRQAQPGGAPVDLDTKFEWILGTGEVKTFADASAWELHALAGIARSSPEQAKAARERNGAIMAALSNAGFGEVALKVSKALDEKIGPTTQPE